MFITFKDSNDHAIILEIAGRTIFFNQVVNGIPKKSSIKGLNLNPSTIVKQFPDLKGKPIPEIKKEAIKRFEEKIKSFKTKDEIVKYLIEDLEKHGYKAIFKNRRGCRPERIK